MADERTLSEALAELREDEVKALVQKKVDAGEAAADIMADCQAGLAQVGKRFETGQYFISELMYAGEIMKGVMAVLEPLLKEAPEAAGGAGTIVIGTVKGDVHDIGKDVVVLMLRGAGYEVVDLGVDVSPEQFVEAARERGAFVVGMSVFLTTCCKWVGSTVEALTAAGLRDRVKVFIGGAAASDFVAERTGCDGFGRTAVDAVELATAAAS
ncbi:MAG: cobalamin B12-binding domain-containing protein [Planctomycetota bacterium]